MVLIWGLLCRKDMNLIHGQLIQDGVPTLPTERPNRAAKILLFSRKGNLLHRVVTSPRLKKKSDIMGEMCLLAFSLSVKQKPLIAPVAYLSRQATGAFWETIQPSPNRQFVFVQKQTGNNAPINKL